jgi:hypothetical protein
MVGLFRLRSLSQIFANRLQECSRQVNCRELRRLHKGRDYTGIVNCVRDSMNLKLRIRVGLVKEAGPAGALA